MNRLILKYGVPITVVILAIFAWVIAQRLSRGWEQLVPLAVTAVVVWAIGVPVLVWLWPRFIVSGMRRAIVRHGFGDGPIPVNTLHAVPAASSAMASRGSLMATGTDDVLYLGGWLELRDGPLVLHVPEMSGRYYAIQFTDPASSADVAYVGTRTTGGGAGEFLLTGPGWSGAVPDGMVQIRMPHRSALVIGRVFAADAADRHTAYELARQMRLTPVR